MELGQLHDFLLQLEFLIDCKTTPSVDKHICVCRKPIRLDRSQIPVHQINSLHGLRCSYLASFCTIVLLISEM